MLAPSVCFNYLRGLLVFSVFRVNLGKPHSPLRKRELFKMFFLFFYLLISSFDHQAEEGRGAKGLSGLPTEKVAFFAASHELFMGEDKIFDKTFFV